MRVYESCKKVIEEIRPDLAILDAIFNPGLDACFMLNQKFILNSPNAPLDATRTLQPWLKGFWYYPAYVSHPMPLHRLTCPPQDGKRDPISGLLVLTPLEYSD
jgi:hypothetical protein